MSLAQHLTAEDEFECAAPCDGPFEANADRRRGSWRRMSFDAFAPVRPNLQPPEQKQPREAAYKASTFQRIVQVALAVLFCFLGSGIVFGFASIKPILVTEGVYSEYCVDNGVRSRPSSRDLPYPCPEQEIRLNFLFIVASVTTNTSSLFAGYTLDRFGRRWCATVAAGFLAIGALMMASGNNFRNLDGFLLGNFFLSLGGTFLFLPSFQLSNAFPKYSGLVVALITCAFDASSAVFYLYRLVWDATQGRITVATFFVSYLVVPLLVVLSEWTIMPKQRYHSMPELEAKIAKAQDNLTDVHASDDDISDGGELFRVRSSRADHRRDKLERIERIAGDFDERQERMLHHAAQQQSDGIWGRLHGLPVKAQMKTPFFVLLLCVTAFQMLRMNFFIATIGTQYRYMVGSDGEVAITNFFNAALPIGGVAATPLIALLLNSCSVSNVLTVLTLYVVTLSILNCLPYLGAGFATVVVFVTFRPFYYSAISYTASKIFGFATFGRVYGTVICASGVFNLVQSGLESLLSEQLHGNPFIMNLALGIIGTILAVAFTGYVKWQSREHDKRCAQVNVTYRNGSTVYGAINS